MTRVQVTRQASHSPLKLLEMMKWSWRMSWSRSPLARSAVILISCGALSASRCRRVALAANGARRCRARASHGSRPSTMVVSSLHTAAWCLMVSLFYCFFVLIFYSSNLRLFFLLITRVRLRRKLSLTCFSYWVVEIVCLFCFFHFVPEDVMCLVCCNFLLCSIVILSGQVVCFACYFNLQRAKQVNYDLFVCQTPFRWELLPHGSWGWLLDSVTWLDNDPQHHVTAANLGPNRGDTKHRGYNKQIASQSVGPSRDNFPSYRTLHRTEECTVDV